ncbi:MAG: hypothetical protein ABI672_04935 [Vicinamibacteria bacterium]
MRLFWAMFFIGSMLLVGVDVAERRQNPKSLQPALVAADGDPTAAPTPRP